jgi:hypothetical protein
MATLFIPAIGDRITLTKPWSFKLYLEHRNITFAESEGYTLPQTSTGYTWNVYLPGGNYQLATVDHTLQPGTVLECDRIYIKTTSKSAATAEDSYDSITWKVVVNNKAVKSKRFWVKLTECFNLEFDETSVSKYRDRK